MYEFGSGFVSESNASWWKKKMFDKVGEIEKMSLRQKGPAKEIGTLVIIRKERLHRIPIFLYFGEGWCRSPFKWMNSSCLVYLSALTWLEAGLIQFTLTGYFLPSNLYSVFTTKFIELTISFWLPSEIHTWYFVKLVRCCKKHSIVCRKLSVDDGHCAETYLKKNT
jgi:hypothetical protein